MSKKITHLVPQNSYKKKKGHILIACSGIFSFLVILSFAVFIVKVLPTWKEASPETKKEDFLELVVYEYSYAMPKDWIYVGDGARYEWMNQEENLYVSLSRLDSISYHTLMSEEYRKGYIEQLEVEEDFSILSQKEERKRGISYYLLEGTYHSYKCLMVITGLEKQVVIVKALFKDQSAFALKKEEVIDFALSGNQSIKL